MKKGTIIECTKDVIIMDNGEKTFTKGSYYRTYPYMSQEGWDIKKVICAKNDQNERHIIKDDSSKFFNDHFAIVEVN